MTYAAFDVDYPTTGGARAAAVVVPDWTYPRAARELTVWVPEVEPYEPGAFYKRELPCIRAVLAQITPMPDVLVVDGYVWLGPDKPGLGARLYEALGGVVPVVGIAKTAFAGAPGAEVKRWSSTKPLFVTAIGMPEGEAARHVGNMHGPHRIPTLLTRVDHLARGFAKPV